jgi:DNA-binding CsgD family transcriptional regulator
VVGAVLDCRFDTAIALCERLDQAARAGVGTRATAVTLRGWARSRRGELSGAADDARAAFELLGAYADPPDGTGELVTAISVAASFLVEPLIERPELAELRAAATGQSNAIYPVGTAAGAWVLLARGRLKLAHGDPDDAAEALRLSGAILEALGGARPDPWSWRSGLALCMADRAPAQAIALAEQELEMADRHGSQRAVGQALLALGTVRQGNPRIASLGAAVSSLQACDAPLELARAQVQLGIALRRANQPSEARGSLVDGENLAQACGATGLATRARHELEMLTSRRRGANAGIAGLTASELRVAQLAATGMSNQQIARTLYVAIRTVTTHLTAVYRKLEIPGRHMLAEYLARTSDRYS